MLNAVFFWFNFYFVDFLDLFARIASFFLIFRPSNVRKNFFKLKSAIDLFFTKKQRVSPIFSLNNAPVN